MRIRFRILLCRALFIVLCAVPTLTVLALSVGHHWPGRVQRTADELEAVLGLRVALQDVRTLRPDVVQLLGVGIADWERGRPLLSADEMTVHRRSDGWVVTAPRVTLEAAVPEIRAWIERSLQRIRDSSVDVRVARVSRSSAAGGGQDWLELGLLIRSHARLAQAHLNCRFAETSTSRATVRWERRRGEPRPETFWNREQDNASEALAHHLGLLPGSPPAVEVEHVQVGRASLR